MARRRRLSALALAAAACLLSGGALAGEIAGKVTPPGRVKSVLVRDRVAKKDYPATLDAATGEYRAQNLPPGTYDIVLETDAGRIEGVDLGANDCAVVEEPMALTPSELDRDEIPHIAARLTEIYSERKKEKLAPKSFVARVREGRFAGVSLRADSLREVPLEGDEPVEIGEAILGLMALTKARDQMPRDCDVEVSTAEDGGIGVTKVAPDLTDKDRAWIVDWIDKTKLFENKKRVLDMTGNGQLARVLVEKIRDDDAGPTTLPTKEPTAFWRVEVWTFRKLYGGWEKDRNPPVIVREQVPIRVFRTYRWMFEKSLGGIEVGDGAARVPEYAVPEKLDPARGRTAY